MPDKPIVPITPGISVTPAASNARPLTLSTAPESLTRGDYTEVVAHAIYDALGAVPVAGAFVTAAANIALNVAAAKQKNRIVQILDEVARRVENAEAALQAQSKSEEFLVLFYRLLYWARDEVSPEKTEAFIRLAKKLLTDKNPYDETRVALGNLAEMSGHELRLLMLLFSSFPRGKWTKLTDFLKDARSQAAIGTTKTEDVHRVLLGLRQKGLISVEQYGAVLGNVPFDAFGGFQLSLDGEVLAKLVFQE